MSEGAENQETARRRWIECVGPFPPLQEGQSHHLAGRHEAIDTRRNQRESRGQRSPRSWWRSDVWPGLNTNRGSGGGLCFRAFQKELCTLPCFHWLKNEDNAINQNRGKVIVNKLSRLIAGVMNRQQIPPHENKVTGRTPPRCLKAGKNLLAAQLTGGTNTAGQLRTRPKNHLKWSGDIDCRGLICQVVRPFVT